MNPFVKRRYGPKKLTAKQKAIQPSMLDAVIRAEGKTVEEIEAQMRGEGS